MRTKITTSSFNSVSTSFNSVSTSASASQPSSLAPRVSELCFPRIAPKGPLSSSSTSTTPSNNSQITSRRGRSNVSRSYSGCLTCRSRKVKCDETHPICSACARLGLSCDYNRFFLFRDDTRRVTKRMQSDVNTTGSGIWDTRSSSAAVLRRTTSSSDQHGIKEETEEEDEQGMSARSIKLSPFSAIVTDEECERKAESAVPGTYFVVLTPDNFTHITGASQIRAERETTSTASSLVKLAGIEVKELRPDLGAWEWFREGWGWEFE